MSDRQSKRVFASRYDNAFVRTDVRGNVRGGAIRLPLLFLQRHDVLVDLFSSFTGWPWLGRKASRFFVAACTLCPPACTTMLLVVVLVRPPDAPFTVTVHPPAVPVGDWYSCRRTPVVGATPLVAFGDEKLLMVRVGALPVTRDNCGENAF